MNFRGYGFRHDEKILGYHKSSIAFHWLVGGSTIDGPPHRYCTLLPTDFLLHPFLVLRPPRKMVNLENWPRPLMMLVQCSGAREAWINPVEEGVVQKINSTPYGHALRRPEL